MDFENKIKKFLSEVKEKTSINNYIFVSIGRPHAKAQVKLFKKLPILNKISLN